MSTILLSAMIPELNDSSTSVAKLDDILWAGGLAFVSHGARIGIRVSDSAVLKRLPDHLPPASKLVVVPRVAVLYSLVVGNAGKRSGSRRGNLLYVGSERLARRIDLDRMLEIMESDLHFRVALAARRRLFVHAGVVGWRGRAIVIPGRSRTGKSSLVAALVRAGATYYSDEYAVFDGCGRVHPYAKPLSLRQENGGRQRAYSVEALGGSAGSRPLPVGLVAVTRHCPGARWRPRTLSPGETLLALFDNTVLAQVRPEFAFTTLKHAVAGAAALQGSRGEAADVVEPLLNYVTRSVRLNASRTRRVSSQTTAVG